MFRKVIVENGEVEGLPAANPRITSFKGIPYAAPPTGENRWRVPQPAKNWDGVLKAYKFGPISMQHIPGLDRENIYSREWNVDPTIEMSEDSLHLNVWTPAKSADEKLPVLVWFFGGGLQEGNTSEMEFDGERIARRGIVVVTINYRLNVFGFFAHPELTAESPDTPTNFGLLDQQFGTHWVKRNIAAFGGDPENITIGGQSAGGFSCLAQIMRPENEGLFQRAVIDSFMMKGAYRELANIHKTLDETEKAGVEFFNFLGVSTLAEARKLDAVYLRDKSVEFGLWDAVVDGKFYLGQIHDMVAQGKCKLIPMMTGHTGSEFFVKPNVNSAEELKAFAEAHYGADAGEFLKLCSSSMGSFTEMMHKATISHFEYSTRLLFKEKKRRGDTAPIYYWVFEPEIPGWDNPGTFHSVDLWFWFETLAKCWRPFTGKHYDLARRMCNYLANFVRTGDPNGQDSDGTDLPLWEPFTEGAPKRMMFCDNVSVSDKGPAPLMKFLLEHSK